MRDADLDELTIASAGRLMRAGSLSPVALTEATLARIERLQPRLNAFITVTADVARQQARAAEAEIKAGHWRGPLHGVPISLKDLYCTAGIPTTAGSVILKDHVPDFDAPAVARLLAAGAVLVGKANMHEWACGVTNDNPFFGRCHNPWRQGYIPGGSSGGSAAAVATRQGLGSLGSDTGGSIRIPAHMCGLVGHKPTHGLVPRFGVFPESWSFDHAGPIALTAEDAAILLEVIAGPDPRDPSSLPGRPPALRPGLRQGVRGLKLGLPADVYFDDCHPEVQEAVMAAVEVYRSLGAEIVAVPIPEARHGLDLCLTIAWAEAAHFHRRWLQTRPDDYGPDLVETLASASAYTAVDYLQAQQVRAKVRHAYRRLFERVDLLISPTGPLPATPHDVDAVMVQGRSASVLGLAAGLTAVANATGEPACSVPCGFTEDGLPIGLMIHGPRLADGLVLRAAHAYEQTQEWHRQRPSLRR
ncbi:aspartyl-tRNA(Asn)/glutamyl-tRNA(Gln) amidotransferase subunit A [Stella humosa]|uniref:Aspartyl-tRNA(Asn)/glutamyl-tRNA(Gln) amidotransferase subunit A n=1 Tax=Stella humosa TaxID=94 RepID=A0A3N1MDQ5_9PROT|nr:amidase [Stella humosa]ROQ01419.1 aspartyl-tRNA(Asn)/glutamyl-tRNA(Gln) amidotransferase subunit A [Stella humosa]BBK31795.1 amidase [Stella humosa]